MRSGFTFIEVLLGTTILAFAIVCIAQMVTMFTAQSEVNNRTIALQFALRERATSFEHSNASASSYLTVNTLNYLGASYTITGTNYRGGTSSYPLEAITFTGQYQGDTIPHRPFTYEAIRIQP